MKYAIVSATLPQKCAEGLSKRGFSLLYLPPWERLQRGVSSHPDMLFFLLGENYICSSEYYERSSDTFSVLNSLGYTPMITDELPSPDYPHDVLFNSLPLGNMIFGLEKNMSLKIKELAARQKSEIVNVRQGYAKCSVCKVSESAIITADLGIAATAEARGIDVLTVVSGHVLIDGYDCGFIGGASGTDGDAVYFCGDLFKHPDGEKIAKFCEKHKKACISLSDETLFDVGTLFFV